MDADGNPTTDPFVAMKGTMAPSGGAKGAALALMVEILAAGLTGAHFSYEASSLFDEKGPPPALGQAIIAIDPSVAAGNGVTTRLAELAAEMASQDGVRLPGRRGRSLRADVLATGLEIENDVISAIQALGEA